MRQFANAAQETWEHDTGSFWADFLLHYYGCGDPRCCGPEHPHSAADAPMDDRPPTNIELIEEEMTR